MGTWAGCVLPLSALRPLACLPLPSSSKGLPIAVSVLGIRAQSLSGPVPASGCLSPLHCLYAPQMRESRWAAETLDKEGLSESVRSCESCPGVGPGPSTKEGEGLGATLDSASMPET